MVKLTTYTGKGGLLVCQDDADVIDYGLVPYKVPAETPITDTSTNHYASNPEDVPTGDAPFNTANKNPTGW